MQPLYWHTGKEKEREREGEREREREGALINMSWLGIGQRHSKDDRDLPCRGVIHETIERGLPH